MGTNFDFDETRSMTKKQWQEFELNWLKRTEKWVEEGRKAKLFESYDERETKRRNA